MHDFDRPAIRSLADLETRWLARRKYWVQRLGRLRLGVEPIEEQLARYRRVTWVLTAVPGFVAGFILVLFAVFRRPDIGLIVAALLFLPIAIGAWVGHALLVSRARQYLAEQNEYLRQKDLLERGIIR
jgi:hypothetical protein